MFIEYIHTIYIMCTNIVCSFIWYSKKKILQNGWEFKILLLVSAKVNVRCVEVVGFLPLSKHYTSHGSSLYNIKKKYNFCTHNHVLYLLQRCTILYKTQNGVRCSNILTTRTLARWFIIFAVGHLLYGMKLILPFHNKSVPHIYCVYIMHKMNLNQKAHLS